MDKWPQNQTYGSFMDINGEYLTYPDDIVKPLFQKIFFTMSSARVSSFDDKTLGQKKFLRR